MPEPSRRCKRKTPRSQLIAERGGPLAARPVPAHAPQIDVAAAIELDTFGFEDLLLDARGETVAMGATPGGTDHALPGHAVYGVGAKRAERHPDRPSAAGLAEDRRDLSVRRDLAPRNPAHDAMHESIKRRHVVASGPGPPHRASL